MRANFDNLRKRLRPTTPDELRVMAEQARARRPAPDFVAIEAEFREEYWEAMARIGADAPASQPDKGAPV